jgi:hypothetical protein
MDASIVSLAATRKQLNAYTFDPSVHLENYVNSVQVDSVDPEKKLFALFDKLTKQFTDVSLAVEEDVSGLQNDARQTEKVLMNELTYNSEKLEEVADAVDSVKLSFDMASEGALRIGGKLSSAERERLNIDKSMELLGYIKIFQETPAEKYNAAVKQESSTKDLREALPVGLQKKNWGTISEVMHDLRKILFELTGDDIKNAQNNVNRVADRVELELLTDFEKTIIEIISSKNEDERQVERARDLAEWLHLFNNGQSIQKRYIFTVVQHRIPNDSFFQSSSLYQESTPKASKGTPSNKTATQAGGNTNNSSTMSWFFGSRGSAKPNAPAASKHGGAGGDDYSDEEGDAAGLSTHYPLAKTASMGDGSTNGYGNSAGMSLMDHLSGLFGMINTVCQEQFSLIRRVFPTQTIARVTRTLIQRIFNDPAFGIQARVDSILCPPAPQPALSLPDYLDALVIVREKLNALFLLLMECCAHPSMRGMGSESACLKKAKTPTKARRAGANGQNGARHQDEADGRGRHREEDRRRPSAIAGIGSGGHGGSNGVGGGRGTNEHHNGHANGVGHMYLDADEEAEEILHSEAEIRDFFDDLVSQRSYATHSDGLCLLELGAGNGSSISKSCTQCLSSVLIF